jgi:uncharacterized protein
MAALGLDDRLLTELTPAHLDELHQLAAALNTLVLGTGSS